MTVFGFTVVALLVAFVPGAAVARAAGVPVAVSAAAAVPVTFAMSVLGALTVNAAGLPWNGWSALITLTVFLALAAGYRYALGRWAPRPEAAAPAEPDPGPGRWGWAGAVGGVAIGAVAMAGNLYRSMTSTPAGIDEVTSGWDELWHASVLKLIDDTGIAAPTRLGALRNVETHAEIYYPDAWHAVGALPMQLLGTAPVAALNLWTIISLALVLPASVAALAFRLVRDRAGARPAALASGLGGALSALLPALPYTEVGAGAVPSAVGIGAAGLAATVVMSTPGAPRRIPLAVLSLVGVWSLHPSGAVLAIGLVVAWWLLEALPRPRRGRVRDLAVLAAVGAGTAVLLLPQILSVAQEKEEIEAYSFTLDASRAESWRLTLLQQTPGADMMSVRWPLLILALVGAVGLLARRNWWAVAVWAGLSLLTVNAIRPFADPLGAVLAAPASAFYDDPRRLGYASAVVLAALIGVGTCALVYLVAAGLRRWHLPARARLGGLVAVGVVCAVGYGFAAESVGHQMDPMTRLQRHDRVISAAELDAFAHLAELPDARTTTVFVNPDEGSGWMYPLHGLHPMFTHYAWPTDVGPNAWALWDGLNRAGTDPEVDRALEVLDVRYVLMSPPSFWDFQQTPPRLLDLDRAEGLTVVYDNGRAQIYEVDAWRPRDADAPFAGWDPTAPR